MIILCIGQIQIAIVLIVLNMNTTGLRYYLRIISDLLYSQFVLSAHVKYDIYSRHQLCINALILQTRKNNIHDNCKHWLCRQSLCSQYNYKYNGLELLSSFIYIIVIHLVTFSCIVSSLSVTSWGNLVLLSIICVKKLVTIV